MFRKLRLQLTSLCIVVVTAVVLSLSAVILHLVYRNEYLKCFQDFEETMSVIYQDMSGLTSISHSWLEETSAKYNLDISILDNGSPILFHRNTDSADMELLFSRAREIALDSYALSDLSAKDSNTLIHREFRMDTDSGSACLASVSYIPVEYGVLNVVSLCSLASQSGYLNSLNWFIIAISVCAIFLLSLFSFFLIRYLIRPLEEGHTRQTFFFAGASHELRSPLAVITSSLDAMETCPERASEFHEIIKKESLRMQRLVNDMFTLSSLDNGSIAIHKEEICLDTLFLETYEKFESLAMHKKIFLELSIPDEPFSQAFCDAERMTQVFTILFDNAISYTPEGGHILASISEAHNYFIITVCDNGPGIPDEAKKEIFLRFYRCDQSRTDKNHFGLGLSIAKEIIKLHGGTILAGDSDEGGAKFTITLPTRKR